MATLTEALAAAKARTEKGDGIAPTTYFCVWPRNTEPVVVHPAEFAPASTDLKPLPFNRMVKAYRASALDGISYAWDKAMGRPHREIRAIEPQAGWRDFTPPAKAAPADPPKDSPLISANGKRLPLAAFSYEELDRRFWSQGKVLYAERLENNRALELQAHDKQPEDMTEDELLATQDREILSESRRSWLELGVKTMTLASYNDDDEGALEDAIPEMDDFEQAEWDDARYAHAFGTALVEISPIVQKQIDWEKRVHRDGPLRKFAIVDGIVRLVPPSKKNPRVVQFDTQDEFVRNARRVLPLLLDRRPLKPALSEEKVRELCKKFDAYVTNFESQQNEFMPKEWHGHWLDSAGMLHYHGIARLSLEEEKYGPYHAVPQDRSELSIGNIEADEDVERLFGTEDCGTCLDGLIPVDEPPTERIFHDPYFPDGFSDPVCNECGMERAPTMRVLAPQLKVEDPEHRHSFAMCMHGDKWHAACVHDTCTEDHNFFDANLVPAVAAMERAI